MKSKNILLCYASFTNEVLYENDIQLFQHFLCVYKADKNVS